MSDTRTGALVLLALGLGFYLGYKTGRELSSASPIVVVRRPNAAGVPDSVIVIVHRTAPDTIDGQYWRIRPLNRR